MADMEEVVSKCDTERFSMLIHRTIDQMLGRRGPQYEEYSDMWSLEDWWKVTDQIKDICKVCGKQNLNKEEINRAAGTLPQKYKDVLTGALLIRKDELRQTLLDQTAAISGNCLKDFDWRLKLVLSSDKLANVREPLIDVDLNTEGHYGSDHLELELNKDEMKQLITSLEAANKALIHLKT